ncbi:uncharacterized protein LOC107366688 [Tetranychus urticae]|nr:uncharacterized protein LOC107366688 [Tetranychus urticae]
MWAYFPSVHLFLVIIYLISFTSGYQMRLEDHYEINSQISDNEIDDSRIENVNSKINDCRKTALWSCGNALLKASKFLDYLIGKESLYAKCSMKKAFLNCLNEMSSKKCGRKRGNLHKLSHKFKQKVAQVLWSTRNCYIAPFFANQLET